MKANESHPITLINIIQILRSSIATFAIGCGQSDNNCIAHPAPGATTILDSIELFQLLAAALFARRRPLHYYYIGEKINVKTNDLC
jgi:hypothetical protein